MPCLRDGRKEGRVIGGVLVEGRAGKGHGGRVLWGKPRLTFKGGAEDAQEVGLPLARERQQLFDEVAARARVRGGEGACECRA